MPGLKVLHVIPSLDAADGGPSVAVPRLAEAVSQLGHNVVVATTSSPTQPRVNSYPFTVISTKRNTSFYKVSFELVRWLNAHVRDFDIVHIHALFSFSSTAAAHVAHRTGVPYIIRPLGVLNQWGLKNRRALLKRLSLALVEKRILTQAAAIHYTSEAEKAEAAKIGSWIARLPSFVIPLPVEAPPGVNGYQLEVIREEFLEKFPMPKGKQIVLFLSRIDRKKGIELLLEAFATVHKDFDQALLVIAGSGDKDYEASLREKARNLGIAESVIWMGFVTGGMKQAILSTADVFVLPSYSENFGIAAAEALAAGVPCILSDQVAIADEVSRAGAAVVTKCDAHEIAITVRDLLRDDSRRSQLGTSGRRFAADRFSVESIGHALQKEYASILAAKDNVKHLQHA